MLFCKLPIILNLVLKYWILYPLYFSTIALTLTLSYIALDLKRGWEW